MKNMIRSLLYEIRKNRSLKLAFIGLILINILLVFINIGENSFYEESGSAMLAEGKSFSYMMGMYFVLFAVAMIAGGDFKDKVINYEVMSGHSRLSIFMARNIIAILVASIGGMILSFVPLVASCIGWGFGNRLVLSDVIIRTFLYLFPFIRIAALFSMFTFLIKNQYAMLGIGYGIISFCLVTSGTVKDHTNFFTAMFNLNLLSGFNGWSVYNISNLRGLVTYAAFDSSVTVKMVAGTVIISLIATGIYLLLGYALFKRDEL